VSKISDMLTGFKRKLKSLNYTNGLLLVVLGGCISRFYMMDFQSPWVDEVHTINEVAPQLSLSEVFEVIKVTEPAPPLYYIVCHYLVKVFEYSSYTLRAFSAVLGVLGILAIYNLGAELFNRKVGMLSAILTDA
jgi:4-amino-4-deoxy-L-arabinose transferase-like glycosyltransferase